MLDNEKSGIGIEPEELQNPKLTTIPVDTAELEAEEKIMEGVEDEEDLNKKNYVKITPTFYVQSIPSEEVDSEGKKIELFKVLNPETNTVETRVLTDEEKHEILVQQLKDSRIKFRNTIHDGNVTTTKFGPDYKKKRQRKNKLVKASRRANRR